MELGGVGIGDIVGDIGVELGEEGVRADQDAGDVSFGGKGAGVGGCIRGVGEERGFGVPAGSIFPVVGGNGGDAAKVIEYRGVRGKAGKRPVLSGGGKSKAQGGALGEVAGDPVGGCVAVDGGMEGIEGGSGDEPGGVDEKKHKDDRGDLAEAGGVGRRGGMKEKGKA